MTTTYLIKGITSQACVAKLKSELSKMEEIIDVDVKIDSSVVKIVSEKPIETRVLQTAVSNAGDYTIKEHKFNSSNEEEEESVKAASTLNSLLRLFGLIICGTLVLEWGVGGFNWMNWLINFTGGVLLLLALYKISSLKRFSQLFKQYDILAGFVPPYGLIYPFLQLILSISFLAHYQLGFTCMLALVLIGISFPGLIKGLVKKHNTFQPLGTVIKIPLIKLNLFENILVIITSALILSKMPR